MKRVLLSMVIVCLAMMLLSGEAMAWGPKAQRAISDTSLQLVSRAYPSLFITASDTSYEDAVLDGAVSGKEKVQSQLTGEGREAVIRAVKSEVQLMREVSKQGLSPYFFYRMGALSTLISDLCLPFSGITTPDKHALVVRMENDIDERLDELLFVPTVTKRMFVRDFDKYFATYESTYPDARQFIPADYRDGLGFDGYLSKGGKTYFKNAVNAVADIWYTILRPERDPLSDLPASPQAVAGFFVDEIDYALQNERNMNAAQAAYEKFRQAAPARPDYLEHIGDAFYAFNTPESKERGVAEWRKAQRIPGMHRRRITAKLGNHYVSVGQYYLSRALVDSETGGGSRDETDLPNAKKAFSQALELDRANTEAARLLGETEVAIKAKEQRRQKAIDTITSAETAMTEAENSRKNNNFANALATYNNAIGLFSTVSDEFESQNMAAIKGIKDAKKNISDVILQVLDLGQEALDKGDAAVDNNQFADAINLYSGVESIVSVIPSDASKTTGKQKDKIISDAQKKIEEAKRAEKRYEEKMKAEKAALENPVM